MYFFNILNIYACNQHVYIYIFFTINTSVDIKICLHLLYIFVSMLKYAV